MWPPSRPNDPTKKYLPLGQVSRRQIRNIDPKVQPSTPATEKLSASFYVQGQPHGFRPNPLPDIYTTCPELRQFKPALNLPLVSELNNDVPQEDDAAQQPKITKNKTFPVVHTHGAEIISSFDPNAAVLKPYVFDYSSFLLI